MVAESGFVPPSAARGVLEYQRGIKVYHLVGKSIDDRKRPVRVSRCELDGRLIAALVDGCAVDFKCGRQQVEESGASASGSSERVTAEVI